MQSVSSSRSLAIPLSPSVNIASFPTTTRSILSSGSSYMSALEKKTAGVVDYVFGAFSGVCFLGNIANVVGKSRELLVGPSEPLTKRFWLSYGAPQAKTELVRDASSAISSVFYMVNALRDTKWLNGRVWGYNTLNYLAAGFSLVSAGCGIVVQLRAISVINTLLESKNSSMKTDSLNEHKKKSLLTINLILYCALCWRLAINRCFSGGGYIVHAITN